MIETTSSVVQHYLRWEREEDTGKYEIVTEDGALVYSFISIKKFLNLITLIIRKFEENILCF